MFSLLFKQALSLLSLILIINKPITSQTTHHDHEHGHTDDHDHGHGHEGLPPLEWFIDQIFLKYSNESNGNTIGLIALEDIMLKLNIKNSHDDHDHEHVRQATKNFSMCYSSNELFDMFHLHDKTSRITKSIFSQMSSVLVWMGISPECGLDYHDHSHEKCSTSNRDKYLFGSLSIIVIWILSIIACTIVSSFKKRKQFIILVLKALAIGTLLSDSLLHIIPASLGLHSHSHGDGHDEHEHRNESIGERSKNDPIWKMSATMATIFFLWMLETFMHHHHHHDHDHDHDHSVKNVNPENGVAEFVQETNDKHVTVKTKNLKNYLKSVQTNGWITFFGDIVHKIADGLAIGGAFSESLSLGFSTSLAILFHELPHELGDYGVLLSSGFRHWTVILLNTITSAFCFVTFLILSSFTLNETFKEWIFTVTTGVFLYIALVNMIPKVKAELDPKDGKKDLKNIFSVIIFFIIGCLLMFLLAIFEDDIKLDISSSC